MTSRDDGSNNQNDKKRTRTTIPTLRKATGDLKRAANSELRFNPNDLQCRIKARFYRRLDELSHIIDKETVFDSKETVIELAGTGRILKWLEEPAFASWFVDQEFIVDTISSLQQKAIDVINTVLVSEEASEGDRLKAARMLLELGDQFPGRKSEVRFLDDRINDMTENETEKEIKRLKGQLDQIGEEGEE